MNTEAFRAALADIPYAAFLGAEAVDAARHTAVMRFGKDLIGNPLLPALHGGAVAGFMELTLNNTKLLARMPTRYPKM